MDSGMAMYAYAKLMLDERRRVAEHGRLVAELRAARRDARRSQCQRAAQIDAWRLHWAEWADREAGHGSTPGPARSAPGGFPATGIVPWVTSSASSVSASDLATAAGSAQGGKLTSPPPVFRRPPRPGFPARRLRD